MKVNFFQRRPREGYSYSLEIMFEDARKRLNGRIEPEVKISRFHNDGILTKFYHVVEAAFRQGRPINHITGEMHFLDILMRKDTVVLTVLDCGMMTRKTGLAQLLVKWMYLKLPVLRARHVTAISEATKREIVEYTDCDPEKVTIIPPPVDSVFQPSPKEFNTEKPVVLHIGSSFNNNLPRLVEALDGLPCRLRVIGRIDEESKNALQRANLEYSVDDHLSREEIFDEYKKCDMLAFVSTFEGFGMPIVEANSVERVVLTSNVSSMPEVAADAAHLVDPYDVSSIREGVLRLIADAEYRERLIENGRRNKLRFDPENIADAYFDVYKKITS